MTEIINNYKFSEELPREPEVCEQARHAALELGQTPISPAVGNHLALLVAALGAQHIVEVGTGTGLTGLWLLSGNPKAVLTSIDSDATNHDIARETFARVSGANTHRLITGRAQEVLPRLNDGSYDLALLDGLSPEIEEQLVHAQRLVRAQGLILVTHVLRSGKLASPTARDDQTTRLRSILSELADGDAHWNILPIGSGILQIVKH